MTTRIYPMNFAQEKAAERYSRHLEKLTLPQMRGPDRTSISMKVDAAERALDSRQLAIVSMVHRRGHSIGGVAAKTGASGESLERLYLSALSALAAHYAEAIAAELADRAAN